MNAAVMRMLWRQRPAADCSLCVCMQGFFYNRYPAPSHLPEDEGDLGTETDSNLGQQLWYHVVGTPQSEDILVLEIPDQPEWQTSAEITDDGR